MKVIGLYDCSVLKNTLTAGCKHWKLVITKEGLTGLEGYNDDS